MIFFPGWDDHFHALNLKAIKRQSCIKSTSDWCQFDVKLPLDCFVESTPGHAEQDWKKSWQCVSYPGCPLNALKSPPPCIYLNAVLPSGKLLLWLIRVTPPGFCFLLIVMWWFIMSRHAGYFGVIWVYELEAKVFHDVLYIDFFYTSCRCNSHVNGLNRSLRGDSNDRE